MNSSLSTSIPSFGTVQQKKMKGHKIEAMAGSVHSSHQSIASVESEAVLSHLSQLSVLARLIQEKKELEDQQRQQQQPSTELALEEQILANKILRLQYEIEERHRQREKEKDAVEVPSSVSVNGGAVPQTQSNGQQVEEDVRSHVSGLSNVSNGRRRRNQDAKSTGSARSSVATPQEVASFTESRKRKKRREREAKCTPAQLAQWTSSLTARSNPQDMPIHTKNSTDGDDDDDEGSVVSALSTASSASQVSGRSNVTSGSYKQRARRAKKRGFVPPLRDHKASDVTSSGVRHSLWSCWVRFCTGCVPDQVLGSSQANNRTAAKREKWATFFLLVVSSLVIVGALGVAPLVLCSGLVSTKRIDTICRQIGMFRYSLLYLVCGVTTFQVFCSLLFRFRCVPRQLLENDLVSAVMVLLPVKDQTEDELRRTIESVLLSSYPSDSKCLVVVVDGIMTAKRERYTAAELVGKILGFSVETQDDECHEYRCLGRNRVNFASVYSGTHKQKPSENDERSLKYVVIVKRGMEEERGKYRAGSKGHRDSQLVVTGMLNRVHHNRQPEPLDMAVVKALFRVQLPAKDIDFLLCLNVGSTLEPQSISHMVHRMNGNQKLMASCGQTRIRNRTATFTTMLQIFDLFSRDFIQKSFEFILGGTLLSLPSRFTMFRVLDDSMQAILCDDNVMKSYSRNQVETVHEQQLFYEDRILSTLLLQHFPDSIVGFVPAAVFMIDAPVDPQSMLMEQSHRMNSRWYNLWYLARHRGLLFKLAMWVEHMAMLILPALVVYVYYLIFQFVSTGDDVVHVVVVLVATAYAQTLPFLVRGRVDCLVWFLLHVVVGIPVLYFLLPLYAVLSMDDV